MIYCFHFQYPIYHKSDQWCKNEFIDKTYPQFSVFHIRLSLYIQ